MRVEKPQLHPMAKIALDGLKADGVSYTPEDVIWLQHLAEACARTHGPGPGIDWLDVPTRVGNLDLYPLSLASEMWLVERAYVWFSNSPYYILLAEAFAMAFARCPDMLQKACDEPTTRKMLRAFASTVGVSYKTLEANASVILHEHATEDVGGPEPQGHSQIEWGDVVGFLCARCGGTPRQWLWEYSSDQVKSIFDSASAMERAEHGVTSPSDMKVRNLMGFKRAVESIKALAQNG